MTENANLELYRLWLEEIARLRDTRQAQSNLCVTVNLGAVSALGFLMSDANLPAYLVVWISLAMIAVNISWITNDAWLATVTWRKIMFARELEEKFPQQPLTDESRNLDWRRRHTFAWLFGFKRVMPVLFLVGFIVILIMELSRG
ncbi:MAG: hypothetical protein AB7H66_05040 [Hyphomonadaceae bacterium]